MPHVYPPEDPRSAASTFAPHQPGAGVIADDVPEKNPWRAGGKTASEATEEFADQPLTGATPGPDRPGKRLKEFSEDELRVAAGLSDDRVPRGEGRKGEAQRKQDAERREEARKSRGNETPLTEAMQRPGEASTSKSSGSKSKSSDK